LVASSVNVDHVGSLAASVAVLRVQVDINPSGSSSVLVLERMGERLAEPEVNARQQFGLAQPESHIRR
jgi:hypothetical protein